MRGPIRAPILLPFGNRNTPAEPHRAVPCAAKPDLLRLAFHVALCRAAPSRPIRSLPCRTKPRLRRRTPPGLAYQACHSLPSQTVPCLPFLASLPRPRSRQISPSQPRLACRTSPYRARPPLPATPVRPRLPCLPIPAFLTMPAKPCGSSIAPGLVTPCLPTPPFNATRSTPANRACPSAPSDACSALHSRPSHALVTSPAMPPRPCPRGVASRALP